MKVAIGLIGPMGIGPIATQIKRGEPTNRVINPSLRQSPVASNV